MTLTSNSSFINELINIGNDYVDSDMYDSSLNAPTSKDHIEFFNENDNLSTSTEDIESDLFSIDSNDNTVIIEMEKDMKSNFLQKLKNLFFKIVNL